MRATALTFTALQTLTFLLPQSDLVDDSCGQDRSTALLNRVSLHLRVRPRRQVADDLRGPLSQVSMCASGRISVGAGWRSRTDLVGRDAVAQSALDAVARDLTRDKVGEPALEMDEEVDDGDLERVGRVGVDLVVGLEHEEALLGRLVLCRHKRRCGGGESRRETCGVEGRRVGL